MLLRNSIKKIINNTTNIPASDILFCSPIIVALSSSILGCYGCPETDEPTVFYKQIDKPNEEYEQTIEAALEFHRKKKPRKHDLENLRLIYHKAAYGPYGGEPTFAFPPDYIGPKTIEILLEYGDLSCADLCMHQPKGMELGLEYKSECLSVSEDGIECVLTPPVYSCEGGRKPPGLLSDGNTFVGNSAIGNWWARLCHLEDAAVHAFVQLAKELAALRAPRNLIDRALEAADDERKHVQMTKAMAIRHGVIPQTAQCAPTQLRDLWSLALDNATEGCIQESFAALQTQWQSTKATDFISAWVLNKIGEDETRHGELSWEIHAWCCEQLTSENKRQLEKAQKATLLDLCTREHSTDNTGFETIGAPTNEEFITLANQFAHEVKYWGHLSA